MTLHTPSMSLSMKLLLASTPDSYLLLDRDLVIQAASATYLAMTGTRETELLGLAVFEAFPPHPDDMSGGMDRVLASMNRALSTGETDSMEVCYPIPDRDSTGAYLNRWWRMSHVPLCDGEETVGILQKSLDITETKVATRDAMIRERLVDNLSDIAFWDFCPTRGTAIVSAAQSRMFALPHVVGLTSGKPFVDRYLPEDRARLLADFAALEDAPAGTVFDGEYRMQLPGGDIHWVRLRGDLVREAPGDPASFVGISMDVTRAYDREATLNAALRERDELLEQKQLLLDEVNHRIKNSLQIVSSILSLDAKAAGGDEARARLSGAAARVRAVASVHELIYKSGDVTTVEVSGYLTALCQTLEASAHGTVTCRADEMVLSTDNAISVALLVNELVANALEHAFEGDSDGHVDVACKKVGEEMVLTVADNGRGKVASSGKGLGTRIVAAMVMKLEASMEEGPVSTLAAASSQISDNLTATQTGHCALIRIPIKNP